MWSNRSTRIKIALTAAAAAATLPIAGCSDNGHDMSQMSGTTAAANPESAEADTATFNDADVTFLQMMYPHHAQAVEMAAMVEEHTTNQPVIDLANAIEAAQGPEMEQMSGLLTQWGKPAAEAQPGDMAGMDHGSGGMSGMMSEDQMSELASKNGAEFDTLWLTMMIDHHNGAIEMAQIELDNGRNADTKNMARTIIGAQQAEIATMQEMLQR